MFCFVHFLSLSLARSLFLWFMIVIGKKMMFNPILNQTNKFNNILYYLYLYIHILRDDDDDDIEKSKSSLMMIWWCLVFFCMYACVLYTVLCCKCVLCVLCEMRARGRSNFHFFSLELLHEDLLMSNLQAKFNNTIQRWKRRLTKEDNTEQKQRVQWLHNIDVNWHF